MFQKKFHSKIRILIIVLIWLMIEAPAEAKSFPIHKQIEGFFNQETFHYNYKSLQALYTKSLETNFISITRTLWMKRESLKL